MAINRVALSGNIGRSELRFTQGGMAVLEFSLAVNDRVKRGNDWEDYTNWIDCKMFGSRAESLSRYLDTGMKVAVDGKLRYSTWEDRKSGGKRSKIEVMVDDLEFMSKGQQDGERRPQRRDDRRDERRGGNRYEDRYDGGRGGYEDDLYDEDIPF